MKGKYLTMGVDAIDAAQTSSRWYRHKDEGVWYAVTAAEVRWLGELLADDDGADAYSNWCAGTPARISRRQDD
jgi:hypothetical protein